MGNLPKSSRQKQTVWSLSSTRDKIIVKVCFAVHVLYDIYGRGEKEGVGF